MSALQPLDPEPRPVIVVHLPAARRCQAADCDGPAGGHVVWLDRALGQLRQEEVCAAHVFLLRHRVRADGGGALFYPLDRCPPLERIADAMRRARAARYGRPGGVRVQFGPGMTGLFNGANGGAYTSTGHAAHAFRTMYTNLGWPT